MIWTAIVNTTSGRLNVRSGPGTQYPRIGSLPKGEDVDVFAEKGDWAYIAGDGLQGYVSKQFLMPSEPPQTAPDNGHEETPAEGAGTSTEDAQAQTSYAVWIPCDSEEEAKRYAGDIKKAHIVRYEKPPGMTGEGE